MPANPTPRPLRRRLLRLAIAPMLLVFPLILVLLWGVGGQRFDAHLATLVGTQLAAAHNYLEQQRSQAEAQVEELAQSERLRTLLLARGEQALFESVLKARAEAARLDALVVLDSRLQVVAASTRLAPGAAWPADGVVDMARLGVSSSGYVVHAAEELGRMGGSIARRARVPLHELAEGSASPASAAAGDGPLETRGLLLTAASHFPLSTGHEDAILVGLRLLNNDERLIDRLRDIVFPITPEELDRGGVATLFLGERRVATTVSLDNGLRATGTAAAPAVVRQVLREGRRWAGPADVLGRPLIAAYEPLLGPRGEPLGMLFVGFPEGPSRHDRQGLFGAISALLALALAGAALLFGRGVRDIPERLARMMATLRLQAQGQRAARVPVDGLGDEISALARHFNGLLDSLQRQQLARDQAQQASLEEVARRRTLLHQLRDGVAVLDDGGRLLEANPRFAEMLGYGPDQLSGLRVGDWDPQWAGRPPGPVPPQGLTVQTVHRRRDGSEYAAEVSVSRVEWGGQALLLTLNRDVSERQQMSEQLAAYRSHLEDMVAQRTLELASARDQAESANRAKSAFLAAMSHELRTPLNGLLGMLHLARQQAREPEQVDQLNQAQLAAGQLARLIADVLDLSQLESAELVLQPHEFRWEGLWAGLRQRALSQARAKGLDFREEMPEALGRRPLHGDPDRLAQVLGYLIDNALKFTPQGEVRVRAELLDERRHGCTLRLEVRDSGPGLPASLEGRVFDSFAQADMSSTRRHGGAGLGLAISQRLVRLMGGEIGVLRPAGGGTTVWFSVSLGYADAPDSQLLALSGEGEGDPGAMAAAVDPGGPGRSTDTPDAPDPANFERAREHLVALLERHDFEAARLWSRDRAVFQQGLGGRYDAADQAMRGFDFQGALQALRLGPADAVPQARG